MRQLVFLLLVVALSPSCSTSANAEEIVHDAEYYVLEAQHGEAWATQDKEIRAKLDALEKKHGTKPNIIHIMWDDTAVGEVGVPQIQKARGWETPNINQFSAEGIYFARMYTEPSCTPSRAAVLTGRHAVRNGMYNVGFPYEYGGLAAEEVTTAEILGKAGYATAFYGKSHLGDVESSYLTNQGFDEALWTPYNQVPSMYPPEFERMGAIRPGSLNPGITPTDPYDIDKGWKPTGYVWALEGVKGGPVSEWGTAPNIEDYIAMDGESQKRVSKFMKKNVEAKKPFFISFWPQMTPFTGFPEKITVPGMAFSSTTSKPAMGQKTRASPAALLGLGLAGIAIRQHGRPTSQRGA